MNEVDVGRFRGLDKKTNAFSFYPEASFLHSLISPSSLVLKVDSWSPSVPDSDINKCSMHEVSNVIKNWRSGMGEILRTLPRAPRRPHLHTNNGYSNYKSLVLIY